MPKYLDFQKIKESVSIEDAAKRLNLKLKQSGNQLRGECPSCKSGNERVLAITPSKNVFFCHAGDFGGDCIALVAHVLDFSMRDAAEWLTEPDMKPEVQKPKQEAKTEKAVQFDPEKFAARLVYVEEMQTLGISEDDAKLLGHGYHPQRKAIYLCSRNPDGSIAGFIKVRDVNAIEAPPRWILPSNVVPLVRRA
ncbi:MAG: hypothetical protein KGZ73_05135 [Rhizobiales bacterium]|nr:hypothetical protein [Hyphomicrobiales bacterium]